MQNLASQIFPTQKCNLEHLSHKVKKTLFFKTLFGFSKMDISWTFINVQNPFPFLLLAITFLHFSKRVNNRISFL